ncbi:MAG: hypothetical protein HZB14_05485 [Actinobacteria bacterium]|nr:hypothetical protein [Actinomycetota bacterium]
MQTMFWIWLLVVLKIPVVGFLWMLWRVINDKPDQVVGEGGGGPGVRVEQGPRKRGPHDEGNYPPLRRRRRGDAGHDDTAPAHQREPVAYDR